MANSSSFQKAPQNNSGLRRKAEIYSVSNMEELLIDLQSMDGDCNQVAAHIKKLLKKYDMDGIYKFISKFSNGKK